MYLIYEVSKDRWNEEFEWLHSILPWTGSKRDWHWKYNNIRETYSIRVSPTDSATELLLKLSRPVKFRFTDSW